MSRITSEPLGQGVLTVQANLIAGVSPEIIGGLTYYRLRLSDFANPFFDKWTEIAFVPGEADWPDDGTGERALTVGAAVQMRPHRMCLWLVNQGALVLPNGHVLDSNTCVVLMAGQSVDLGGWIGDVFFREDPGPVGPLGGADWTNGAVAAILGTICVITIDPLIDYVGGGSSDRAGSGAGSNK